MSRSASLQIRAQPQRFPEHRILHMPALVSQKGSGRIVPHKGAISAPFPLPPTPGAAYLEAPHAVDASSLSGIATWACNVTPGEPAPHSPRKHVSHESTRSNKHHSSKRGPSSVPLPQSVIPPPEASEDLARLGYTSFFVDLPRRERDSNAQPATVAATASDSESSSTPTVTKKSAFSKTLKAFSKTMPRLDGLRFQSTSAEQAEGTTPTSSSSSKPKRFPVGRQPAPMENELALMQFLGGGKVETHARTVMRQQAPRSRRTSTGGGVPAAYRDARGQHWLDRDEALEYRGPIEVVPGRDRESRRPPPLHLAHPDRINRPSRRADSAHASRSEYTENASRQPSTARPASSKGRTLMPSFLARKS
ncbi:hypothetical protein BD626DRAFT_510401 [Schizophyllum amplum]|uniref:Pal1 cell morphology protein-domain-containing protein n=1 Tax=Schizophyllum amplum TaxID=97359 RepID=A0A550C1U0_9AGAR|nr:hypothetical protein BD626DRAFT_510401 [Auriculariopsis ampla]